MNRKNDGTGIFHMINSLYSFYLFYFFFIRDPFPVINFVLVFNVRAHILFLSLESFAFDLYAG